MAADSRPRRCARYQWCTLDEGALVIDPEDGRTWALNPTGLFIWDRCDGEHDAASIASELAEFFDIDLNTALEDLQIFLMQMRGHGLVETTTARERV